MEALLRDLRIAARSLARARLTAATLLVTLALGVGANATVFSFVKALLLAPLPFKDPEKLVRVESVRGGETGKVAAQEVLDFNERAQLFEGFAAYRSTQWNHGEGAAPEAVPGTIATFNLFALLGARRVLGETWPASHDRSRVFAVVMSHGLWKRRFGADPGVVGRTIFLDAAPYTVLGVMEEGFRFPGRADLWRRSPDPDYDTRAIRASSVVARLRPSVGVAQAQAELDGIAARLEAEFPETNRGVRFRVSPLREAWIGDARAYLFLLSGAVGFVLLIACSNAAGLLLARALEREHEVAVRLALGAGRAQILRLALAEGLVLALPTALLGVAAAFGGVRVFATFLSHQLPPWMQVRLDGGVLAFTVGIAILAAMIASLLPARQAWRVDVQPVLRDASTRVAGGRRARTTQILVGIQLGLALLLLSGAGLMVRSVLRLAGVDLGFDPTSVLTTKIDPPWSRFSKVEQTAPLYRRLLDEIATVPGVTAAAANDALPLTDLSAQEGQAQMEATVEGQSPTEAARNPPLAAQIVSHGYFGAVRIPLLAGRAFDDVDRIGTTPAAVIGERAAERLWPGQSAVGRRLRLGRRNANYRPVLGGDPEPPWLTIVGVVGSVRREAARPAGYDLYLSDQQSFAPETYLVVRGQGDPAALATVVRKAVLRVDPEQSVFDVRTLDQRRADLMWQQRLSGTALLTLAWVALALAAIGLYGLVARSVAARRREIAIRTSLGATPRDVLGLVLGDVVPLLAAGSVAGLLGAAILHRLLAPLVHAPVAADWLVLPAVAVLLSLVAMVAAAVPARRAARGDPAAALRAQ